MLDLPNDRLLIAQISLSEFHAASFLDQRIFTDQMHRSWANWDDVANAGKSLNGRSDFIFHIGHVGSTLISRLLGELNEVFALREPLILRSLAEIGPISQTALSPWSPDRYRKRLREALIWLARSPDPKQRTLVKASSFVSAIGGDIMADQGKMLLLTLPPERYIATILAGDASRQELATLSGARLKRLHDMLGEDPFMLWQLDEATRAAMAWATEMLSLMQTAQSREPRDVMWLNFDDFLRDPGRNLDSICRFFGYAVDEGQLQALTASPIMTRYSKAPEHGYSTELRRQVLDETMRDRQTDIHAALAWLDSAASEFPQIAHAISQG